MTCRDVGCEDCLADLKSIALYIVCRTCHTCLHQFLRSIDASGGSVIVIRKRCIFSELATVSASYAIKTDVWSLQLTGSASTFGPILMQQWQEWKANQEKRDAEKEKRDVARESKMMDELRRRDEQAERARLQTR